MSQQDYADLFRRAVIVTGGDANYAHLIEDLLASVRAFPAMDATRIMILDGGLTEEQKAYFKDAYRAEIYQPDWSYGYSAKDMRVRGREHLKILLCRTLIDKYVGDSELVLWIDADAWVNDIEGIGWMLAAADQKKLAIVCETSRYSKQVMQVRWRLFGHAQIRSILYKNARRSHIPEKDARKVGLRPTLNPGVFALHRDAPHWDIWRKRQEQVLNGGCRIFTSDQLSLSMAVYLDGVATEFMPEHCNYMGPWKVSADGKTLVEAYMPNHPLTVVHMAGFPEQRTPVPSPLDIEKVGGGHVTTNLRFGAWKK